MTNRNELLIPSCISFAIVSDLHLETPPARPSYSEFSITNESPHLALLGDIGLVNDTRLCVFLKELLTRFKTVFYVLGNHEPYDGSFQAAKAALKEFEKQTSLQNIEDDGKGMFVLLDQARCDMSPTLTVLGCTLFSAVDPDQASSIQLFVSDFERIQDWDIDRHNNAHKSDLEWLNQEVASITQHEPERKIMIFTHYSPTLQAEANDPRHLKDDSGVRSAFMTDLSTQPCWTARSVVLWAFGHTHFNCDFVDSSTGKRVIANQKGYRRSEAADFEPGKIVEITTASSDAPMLGDSNEAPSKEDSSQTQDLPKHRSGPIKRLGKLFRRGNSDRA